MGKNFPIVHLLQVLVGSQLCPREQGMGTGPVSKLRQDLGWWFSTRTLAVPGARFRRLI